MNALIRIFLLFIVVLLVTSFSNGKGKHYALTTVVIDAGHGGHDSGCIGKNSKEKDVSLAVALKLGKYIEDNYKDVRVIYTRKKDVFLELHERVAIANNARADLFICIHCNSASSGEVYGPETWVMGLHMSKANLEVSKRENEVVLLEKDYVNKYDGFNPNSPEANIIFSLYQNAYIDQSLRLASLVQQEFKAKGRSGRGVKQAGFLVLYKTSMPSILVETGFLSNVNEEKYLASAKGQDEIAHAIFNAFKTYKYSVESYQVQNEGEYKEEEICCDPPMQPIKPFEDDALPDTSKQKKTTGSSTGNGGNEAVKGTEQKKSEVNKTVKKDAIHFSVQFLLTAKALSKDSPKFKGEKNVEVEKANGFFKYRSGNFSSLEEALQYRAELIKKGFADAFVVAFKNGNKITIREATESIPKN